MSKVISIVILSLVSLIITLPLFLSNSLIISQDILWHLVWSEQFQKALMEGVLYPRWVDTPFGYGSPTFIFYAPLSFYVISIINVFINSEVLSINLAIYLSFFLSGISMYFFARKLNGKSAGLISGVLYQLLPYHIFDLYSRGVIPELFAFIWFPLILLFMRKIFTGRKFSSIALFSLVYASLILTHLVSAFMFTFVMVGYGLYLSFIEKKKGILRMLYAITLSIGLSTIYLIPVIFEREFTHIELIKIYNYRDNFLFLYKNLLSREFYTTVHRIAIVEITFLIFSLFLIRRKLIKANNTFFVMLLFISLVLTTPLSSLIWQYIAEFPNLQFPWRWLIFSGLSVSIVAGDLIANFRRGIQKSAGSFLLPSLVISLFLIFQVSYFSSKEIDDWKRHSSTFSPIEYRPIWLNNPKEVLPAVEKIKIVKGKGTIDIIDWKSNRRIFLTDGETPLKLKFSTFYYLGWKAKIDGRQSNIMIEKDTGSMLLEVPEGTHKVELIFEDTPVRYYAKVISLISLIVIFSSVIVKI